MSQPMGPTYPGPNPPTLPGPSVVDPTGLTFDRADLDEPATAHTAGWAWAVTGRDPIVVRDLGCGHIAGDQCDDECAYWRGVATGEYPAPETYAEVITLPAFDLRRLREQHITAAELDRRERGAA